MRRFVFIACALLATSGFARADAFDEIEKNILEKFAKVKTMKASFATEVVREQPTTTFTARGSGTVEMMKRDNTTLLRMDLLDVVDQTGPQNETFQRTRSTISDGTYQYLLSEFNGEIQAYRFKYDPAQNAFDSAAVLKTLRKDFNVNALPEEEIDGERVHVLEAMPIVYSDKEPIVRKQFFFSKKTGLLIKRIGFDATDVERDQFLLTNIKINEEIKKERFEFRPPAGIGVADMTGETAAVKEE